MKIAVIILHYGHVATTKNCFKELKAKIGDHQVILINNTQDNISDLVKLIPGTKLINNHSNLGFAGGVNQGIKLALSDQKISTILLLNNDLTITHGSLEQLRLTFAKFPHCGIVSPVLHHHNQFDWGGKYNRWSGMVKHKNWENKPKTVQTVAHVAGAAMLISREVIDKIGMLDERFFLYFEDLDFCLRATAEGFTVLINPDVVAQHAVSSGTSAYARTKYQWISHFKFVTKHLFRLAYPTAYLYDLFIYPLWLVGTVLKRNSRLQAEKGSSADERTVPHGTK